MTQSKKLEIQNITKQFHTETILNGLSFHLNHGNILSIVGPSGSGKTTLLRILAGLEKPTDGTILMNGKDITKQKAYRRNISLVFQQPLLFPHMTVKENIVYGAKVSKKYKAEKIETLLEAVGMKRFSNYYPSEISGGQQQRTSLARAMATEPEVILFDEPFSSLDPSLRKDLRYWVRNFLVSRHTTAVFVTHDMEEAMIMGDEIAVFKKGTFQQIDTAEILFKKPSNKHVASFLGGHLIINDKEYVSLQAITVTPPNQKIGGQHFDATVEHMTYQYGSPIAHLHIRNLNKKVSLPVKGELPPRVELHIPPTSIQRFSEEHS
ncbi:iron(III) transport system ATP-binding protein/sulfate transport system ATP-binding protein/putative spermidine/putrescine transport system ATP-binding protein [Halobacillus karajensis]|uniref:Carnitine transport ATP-binding protein OpuCA n=1 Tax=Halobacillus karajensis TaxID=195088 RepID=A0A024PAK2_9BACI|nr:heme ABC exporter ATP-binding protein CcmA [Halobacillus karajensis]CDQ21528.1 Sulfate/thiosulfate import ATP-binding protein CysA [Halobacillus karajensis]CDQ25462.1 Sulfate/thiosulfate import ATP-binding protein CysA [Halobacillus karajensis]CDQ29007.1 Sulfate/thiosulfate import ATP-binding protein CysA [Halobacillus karajensis]SEI09250.1 iron(III) transport system ATP-binding protein/sulfate transport system ATP-binding protein/putative spermidine/putrescine transport system ATP-binding p